MKKLTVVVIISIILILCACTAQQTAAQISTTNNPLPSTTDILVPTSTHTPTLTLTPRGKPAITQTNTVQSRMGWQMTNTAEQTQEALATQKMEYATQTQAAMDTQIAVFQLTCGEQNGPYMTSLSPNGKWYAISCGNYDENPRMILKSNAGIQWVFYYNKYVYSHFAEGYGAIFPFFWSPDGKYLYFSVMPNIDIGGTQCLVYPNSFGIFRIDLVSGDTKIIVTPSSQSYDVSFSPTGEYLAVDIDGLTLINLDDYTTISLPANSYQSSSWSPNGRYLVFTEATCGSIEEWYVETSAAYVYDIITKQTQTIMSVEDELLRAGNWPELYNVEITGEKYVNDGKDVVYTIYLYNIDRGLILLSQATATP